MTNLGGTIQNPMTILDGTIQNRMPHIAGPYRTIVYKNAGQESPLICQPIAPLAEKYIKELIFGCIHLGPMCCPSILSPFRTPNK